MTTIANPVPALEALLVVFEDGAAKGGTFVDQVLCGAVIEGLADAIIAFGQLASRMEAAGLLAHDVVPLPGPRTSTARRLLAAFAEPVDGQANVLRLPVPSRPQPVPVGGPAA